MFFKVKPRRPPRGKELVEVELLCPCCRKRTVTDWVYVKKGARCRRRLATRCCLPCQD